jgi:predicted MFS family arabinose efflux permease
VTLLTRFNIYSLAGCVSLLSLLVLPAMVGVLVDESPLTESQAGLAASIGFFGAAGIAFYMTFRMHSLDLRKTAMLSFALAAVGDWISSFVVDSPALFMFARFLTGVAAGAAYTAIMAAFARERHVDRGYGIFITLQFIVSGLGLYLVPVYSSSMSVSGMFLAFAAMDLAALVLCHWLPGKARRPSSGKPGKNELSVLLAKSTLFGALGFALFEAANTAQFTYVERYGVSMQLSDHQVGLALMIGSLAGIPGAFAIVLTGSRFGRKGPLTIGMSIAVAGLWMLISAGDFSSFMTGSVLMGFSWAFCLPYIQGMLAALDRNGSAVAAGSASSTIGGAMGPGLAALIVSNENYHAIFYFAMVLFLLALGSFFFTSKETADAVN